MGKRRNTFWHVPVWSGGQDNEPASGLNGTGNEGPDIVNVLVDTNQSLFSLQPERDEFVVKRIIGQYRVSGTETAGAKNRFMAHRVYPVTSDASSVALRDLYSRDDADSDFLWHQVDPWAAQYDADAWGQWQNAEQSGVPAGRQYMGRFGHFDIGVNRRISEGESLIWHTQFSKQGGGTPADDVYFLQLWIRLLVSEA